MSYFEVNVAHFGIIASETFVEGIEQLNIGQLLRWRV